ncbi:MAG: hypothetical protein GWN79_05380, partial [Actinobacteria bacterium]|nr:hypothetical protein [Actinomycetota bacterium]NIS30145.1 hypothetical protein [Actinomycetota bacterium]NIU18549.1 hypothetical protein [Actinomycetota bacterium]NIU65402.1 hypothetical protein [Actinomycetota bacterium]NIV86392.1 hypothetical protein [Actinomycetota bacterium]
MFYFVSPDDSDLILGVTDLGDPAGSAVFAVYLDDSGLDPNGPGILGLTYVDFEQIDHPDDTEPDDPITVEVGYTVEGPGGTADGTASVQLLDDGPNATLSQAEGSFGDDVIDHDESDVGADPLPQAFVDALGDLGLVSLGQSVDTVHFDYGRDAPFALGGGGTSGGVALTDAGGNAFAGEDSGIVRTADGQSVFLFSVPGNPAGQVVVGIAGADPADAQANFDDLVNDGTTDDLVLALTLDTSDSFTYAGPDNEASADVQFVQFQAVEHPVAGDDSAGEHDDQVAFSVHYTVTDGDGDSDSQELVVQIDDDGPAANGDTNLVAAGTVAQGDEPAVDAPIIDGDVVAGDAFGGVADVLGTDGFGSIAWQGEAGGTVAGSFGTLTV